MHPHSRGWISLNPDNPADPEAPPIIDTQYFSDPDQYDLEALADALGSPAKRAALAARGTELVYNEFAVGPHVDQLERVYQQIMSR